MDEKLQLALLGSVDVRRAGNTVTGFRSSKTLALLCYLAVTGRSHSRPALAGLLWGDFPEANARNNLRKALTYLRQVVGSHISTTRQTAAFNQTCPYWLDVERFESGVKDTAPALDIERLQDAVELYRGDFLEGFFVRQAQAFEEWALAERIRLRELVLNALHTLAVYHTRRGEAGHAAAIDYTTRLLTMEPWREEAHRDLMLLLAQSDQQSAALAQYLTCRQVLAGELGVEPSPETTALYERIRAGKPDQLRAGPVPLALPAFLTVDPRAPHSPAPFAARTRELAQLDTFLDRTLAGSGLAVFIAGEAGTGKTVLIQEFGRRAQERQADLIVASGNCNAHTGAGDPYLPFRDILRLLTGDIEGKWTAGAIDREHACRLWRLTPYAVRALLSAGPDLVGTFISAPALGERSMLASSNNADWLSHFQTLAARKQADSGRPGLKQHDLFEQYSQVLATLARVGPLLLVIDDLQWIDVGSVNLLFHLCRRLGDSRILIVGLYRPADVAMGRLATSSGRRERHPLEPVIKEFQRQFGQIQIDLRQTEDRQFVAAFVDTESNRLGAKFQEALYQQTKGHALFTVEMLQGMRERGDLVLDESGYWVEGPTLDWQTMPARVDGIIGERIGRVPAELQATLKVASVEGENFTAEVAARVREIDELDMVQQLSSQLDRQHRLVSGQGCRRMGTGGQRLSCYRFKHILFQRYLYHSLDDAERAYLHEAVGNGLEALYEEHLDEMAIQLARHFRAAGLVSKAVAYLRLAGERAKRLSANEEAMGHFTEALELLKTLPDTPEHIQHELTIQLALAVALTAAKGYAAPTVERAYVRARELCRQMDQRQVRRMVSEVREFPELMGLSVYIVGGRLQSARKLAEQALRSAQNQQDQAFLLQCHFSLGHILFHLGQLEPARLHLDQCLKLYSPRPPANSAFHLQNPKVTCLSYSAWCLWHLGYPDQALEKSRQALSHAQELSHPYSLAYALNWVARLHLFRREWPAVQKQAGAAITLSTEQGFTIMLAFGIMLRGAALVGQGELEEGISRLREGLAIHRSTGAEIAVPYFLTSLAEAYAKGNRSKQAEGLLSDAEAAMARTEERFGEAELYRLRGELLLKAGGQIARQYDSTQLSPEACFLTAIEIARKQRAKSLELRAVMSLGQLWHGQGKVDEAHQLLSEIIDWFSEGFDTPDLSSARALLATFVWPQAVKLTVDETHIKSPQSRPFRGTHPNQHFIF